MYRSNNCHTKSILNSLVKCIYDTELKGSRNRLAGCRAELEYKIIFLFQVAGMRTRQKGGDSGGGASIHSLGAVCGFGAQELIGTSNYNVLMQDL